ncbi:MAG: endonuclease/exonuclease/phosphatase family protein [Clostridia bacterium]|nr:endonuclease/exonuclease/phosphatase family protein [Clostridia bacterium]
MEIKLMSFNTQHCLNYLEQKIDYDVMVNAIKSCGAEIIGLNEMRNKGEAEDYEAQTEILANRLGYYHYFAKAIDFEGTNPYGNSLISKYPILSAKTVLIPEPKVRKYDGYYEDRCLLLAELDINGQRVNVMVIHFGLNPDEAENAVKAITDNLPDGKVILMGDFNLPPESELLLPIKEKLFDTATLFGENKLSYPSDDPYIKIDYIFLSRNIKAVSADIPEIIASDHRPHTATIEI